MMKKLTSLAFFILFFHSILIFGQNAEIIVLGIAQDAGFPQANCTSPSCQEIYGGKESRKHVSSLGIIDPETGKYWMIDCTPDFKDQLKMLSDFSGSAGKLPEGIFLTQAYAGHYFGLVEFGREALNTSKMPIYAMPRLRSFLEKNAPWERLIRFNNISLSPLQNNQKVELTPNLSITPLKVPYLDEYSETVGFMIESSTESMLYIPDIDKWEKWDKDIVEMVKQVDYALLDGTFYKDNELPGRSTNEIPHPSIVESLEKFSVLTPMEKAKIHFTHFNHTNPLLSKKSLPYRSVFLNGYNVASEGLSFYLN